jgi:hypothetical protein
MVYVPEQDFGNPIPCTFPAAAGPLILTLPAYDSLPTLVKSFTIPLARRSIGLIEKRLHFA